MAHQMRPMATHWHRPVRMVLLESLDGLVRRHAAAASTWLGRAQVLLFRITASESTMPIDLGFLAIRPVEAEYTYPPGVFLEPGGLDLATSGRIAIIGAPAAGKSTLTRQLMVLAAREQDLQQPGCLVP